ncbi:hypothetical protein GCM10011583_57680 [Streptomyces camponoticapitis]|uniref:HNH nuclease domain-containing protein n=1 Tax=Streptomyces camponoticapitis TaxID=1616125 RepID=A0ABQ2ERD0_9ACTN|nr:HNH endonuclease [Streptomyces camponoticapitis]GGK18270.1 hypothetical protein GCM10011583_57680 [Streptomyces camponoticapitis]
MRGRCDEHQPIAWANRPGKQERYGISSGEWRKLKRLVGRRDHDTCYVCGGEADEDEGLELDHITPVAEGGAVRDPDNLGLIHPEPCHADKSRREAARGNERRHARGVRP